MQIRHYHLELPLTSVEYGDAGVFFEISCGRRNLLFPATDACGQALGVRGWRRGGLLAVLA